MKEREMTEVGSYAQREVYILNETNRRKEAMKNAKLYPWIL
jgi:hypothetical protein